MFKEIKTIRRVQETGGTFLISLPKAWAKRWGVRRGSLISIRDREDGCLVLDPKPGARGGLRVAILRYFDEEIKFMEWGITGAYLLGYDIIHLKASKRIKPEEREMIRGIIRRLIGLEILEETAHSIQVHCLLDMEQLIPRRVLQRMGMITLSMIKDGITAILENDPHLAEVVVKRDEEVDRLYFLLVRLLRKALQTPMLIEKLEISPIECMDYRVVATFLETVADYICDVAEETLSFLPVDLSDAFLIGFKEVGAILEEMQVSAIEGFLTSRIKTLEEVRRRYEDLLGMLKTMEEEAKRVDPSKISNLLSILSLIEKIGECYIDMADLISPKEIIEEK
jgi:phosphate uptake regulator